MKKKLIYLFYVLPKVIKFKIVSTGKYSGVPKCVQPAQINGKGIISFGQNVTLGYNPSPFLYSGYGYIEARTTSSFITIEDNVHINNNIVLISDGAGIHISRNTFIGTNCEIYDSNFHNLDVDKRDTKDVEPKEVHIDENVFIGSNVKILKGVSIGKNSVIANGSIVTENIPGNVIAGGIPAKVIRDL